MIDILITAIGALFATFLDWLEERTGWPSYGER